VTTGPGKYDDLATIVREQAEADAAIVIVLNGNKGSGFSVQALIHRHGEVITRMPELLREIARQIERDVRQ
jgi:hypothetical protein